MVELFCSAEASGVVTVVEAPAPGATTVVLLLAAGGVAEEEVVVELFSTVVSLSARATLEPAATAHNANI